MSVPLKYIGAQQRYFDTVDGSREQWTPGDSSDVADSAALGLIATGYFGPVEGAPLNNYTAAQLSAMAAAGTLTPFATYVASDDQDRTLQTAKDSYTLIPAAFNGPGTKWALQSETSSFGNQIINLDAREPLLVPAGLEKAGVLGCFANGEQWNNVPPAASVAITGSITGDKLTVSAVGPATNANGTTLPGAVNRGHYITTIHTDLPANTYIIFDPTDTGDHGAGIYTLSAPAANPIASQAFTLSAAQGIGGVLEWVTDGFMGSSVSADPYAKRGWKLSIKPTHRVTAGHGRCQLVGNLLPLRRHYKVEAMFRMSDSNGSWQQTSSAVTMPSPILISSLSVVSTSDFDTLTQYVTNGPFAVAWDRGAIHAYVRPPDEAYAVKSGGFWSWEDSDRMNQFAQTDYVHYMVGTDPIRLVYEFFLDERMRSDGGQGWLKCWINNRLILDYEGPTMYPPGKLTGQSPMAQPRFGMYDTTYDSVASNTLCSAVRSTALERNIILRYWRVKEIA